MAKFITCTIVLALVPMAVLNPLGRPAFLGYYVGVVTAWLAVMAASQWRGRQAADPRP